MAVTIQYRGAEWRGGGGSGKRGGGGEVAGRAVGRAGRGQTVSISRLCTLLALAS